MTYHLFISTVKDVNHSPGSIVSSSFTMARGLKKRATQSAVLNKTEVCQISERSDYTRNSERTVDPRKFRSPTSERLHSEIPVCLNLAGVAEPLKDGEDSLKDVWLSSGKRP